MILKLANNHSYSTREVEILSPYLDKEITLEQLIKIPMVIAIAESTDEELRIDHPIAW